MECLKTSRSPLSHHRADKGEWEPNQNQVNHLASYVMSQ